MTPILLVTSNTSVSREIAAQLQHGLTEMGFSALILRVHRTDGIPVEVHNLSLLTPSQLSTIEQIVKEYTGKDL